MVSLAILFGFAYKFDLVDHLNAESGFFCRSDILELIVPALDLPKDVRY